jgi:hypothetical protein
MRSDSTLSRLTTIVAGFKHSPLRSLYTNFLVQYLAPLNSDGEVEDIELISWMPVSVPQGSQARNYYLSPKNIMRLSKSKESFMVSTGWNNAAFAIKEIQEICLERNIRLILAYAPSKIHVALPLLKGRLPGEKFRAYAAFGTKEKLPPTGQFIEDLYMGIEVQESVLSDFSARNSIEFVSPTVRLRQSMSDGRQVYFTYDPHFSPDGHEVVAEVIGGYLHGQQSEWEWSAPR